MHTSLCTHLYTYKGTHLKLATTNCTLFTVNTLHEDTLLLSPYTLYIGHCPLCTFVSVYTAQLSLKTVHTCPCPMVSVQCTVYTVNLPAVTWLSADWARKEWSGLLNSSHTKEPDFVTLWTEANDLHRLCLMVSKPELGSLQEFGLPVASLAGDRNCHSCIKDGWGLGCSLLLLLLEFTSPLFFRLIKCHNLNCRITLTAVQCYAMQ